MGVGPPRASDYGPATGPDSRRSSVNATAARGFEHDPVLSAVHVPHGDPCEIPGTVKYSRVFLTVGKDYVTPEDIHVAPAMKLLSAPVLALP